MAIVSNGRQLAFHFVAIVWFMTSLVAGRDGFKDYRVDSLGESELMRCNESLDYTADIWNDSVPVAWMLPNLTVLTSTQGRFFVGPDIWTLEVVNITRSDLGLYHCMLKIGPNLTDWYLARLGLNSEGPYFKDMWAEYEMNTIIGLSAGLGFLAVAVASMLIYHYRWQPEDEPGSSSSVAQESSTSGHDAHASEDGEVEKSPTGEYTTPESEGDGDTKDNIPMDTMSPMESKVGGMDNPAFTGNSSSGSKANGLPDIST